MWPLAAPSSLLLYVAMPNPLLYFPPAVFISFVPLMALSRAEKGWRRSASAFSFTSIFALLVLIPLDPRNIVWVFSDVLSLIMIFQIAAFIYALVFLVSACISDRFGWMLSPVIYGLMWAGTGSIMSRSFSLPHFPLETSLSGFPSLILSAGVIGPYLIGSMIIFTNAVILLVLTEKDGRVRSISLAILLMVHSANLAYGSIALNHREVHGNDMRVAIVQPNISSREFAIAGKLKLFDRIVTNRLMGLTLSCLAYRPDLIIWPEQSIAYLLQNDEYLGLLKNEITSKGPELLIGTNYLEYSAVRKRYNVAFILQDDGRVSGPYKKSILFPFSESQIYYKGGRSESLESSSIGKIGISICLESMFPRIFREQAKEGAKICVCISNDASFGNSMIPYIHAASIVFRAIENDRYAAHVGNTGPSIICDNKGKILTFIPYGKSAIAFSPISL